MLTTAVSQRRRRTREREKEEQRVSTYALWMVTQERGCADVRECVADAEAGKPMRKNSQLFPIIPPPSTPIIL